MTRDMPIGREARRAARCGVGMVATVREIGSSQRFEVDVIDMSMTGFRCQTSFTLRPGQTIFLTIPTFAPLEAQVAWRDGFRYGCAFSRTLHNAVLDHIAARFRR